MAARAGTASGGARQVETGEYRCREPGCGRTFKVAGALHTHMGWHKRQQRIASGEYDAQSHRLKETHTVVGRDGKAMQLSVYRCDQPGCNKVFSARAALYTHIGWHKRQGDRGDSSTTEAGGSAGPSKKRARVSADSASNAQRDLNSDLLEVLRQRELAESRLPMRVVRVPTVTAAGPGSLGWSGIQYTPDGPNNRRGKGFV